MSSQLGSERGGEVGLDLIEATSAFNASISFSFFNSLSSAFKELISSSGLFFSSGF